MAIFSKRLRSHIFYIVYIVPLNCKYSSTVTSIIVGHLNWGRLIDPLYKSPQWECIHSVLNGATGRMLDAWHHMNSFKDSIKCLNVCQKRRSQTKKTQLFFFGRIKMLKFHCYLRFSPNAHSSLKKKKAAGCVLVCVVLSPLCATLSLECFNEGETDVFLARSRLWELFWK